ncbi:hypothetical protein E1295_34845 [Nonomuraea mesophila]|uniref:UspA domain-containing protein n=1 Tax=Nonomuraea mesophila TaxID=2530382 RepID=A0A4R5EQ45_9ACTN|nr:universal stress protein [Nonomuraea mesophila]TDE36871.1 hypothetical protein E1295_34845 [Nonomuraea mesophila]
MARPIVAAAADRARAAEADVEVGTELLSGNVVDALICQSVSADSMVLGNRGRGRFAGLLLGSVSMAVAGHAAGPVVIVRESVAGEHGRTPVRLGSGMVRWRRVLGSVGHGVLHRAACPVAHALPRAPAGLDPLTPQVRTSRRVPRIPRQSR